MLDLRQSKNTSHMGKSESGLLPLTPLSYCVFKVLTHVGNPKIAVYIIHQNNDTIHLFDFYECGHGEQSHTKCRLTQRTLEETPRRDTLWRKTRQSEKAKNSNLFLRFEPGGLLENVLIRLIQKAKHRPD